MIEVSTKLSAPATAVWARAVTEEGINDELRPVLRMTMPRGMDGATIEDVPTGETLGRSWILLGGLLPVDYDDLRLESIDTPLYEGSDPSQTDTPLCKGSDPSQTGFFRFQERSRTASFAVWTHERIVEPAGEGACMVTDRLGWELKPLPARVPGSGRLAAAIVDFLFRHRHRRLARHWG